MSTYGQRRVLRRTEKNADITRRKRALVSKLLFQSWTEGGVLKKTNIRHCCLLFLVEGGRKKTEPSNEYMDGGKMGDGERVECFLLEGWKYYYEGV